MVTVYETFAEILNAGRNPARRTIKGPRATYVTRKGPDLIALTYQTTEVIIAREDGRVILDSGGWKTVTTKARINEYGPCGYSLGQHKGIWTLYGPGPVAPSITCTPAAKSWPFADGIMINETTGRVSNYGDSRKDLAQRKILKKYVDKYYTAMVNGDLGIAPGPGDCLFCLCGAQGGTVEDPGSSHLGSHLEEVYLVPSLGINVLKEGYVDVLKEGSKGQPTVGTSLSRYAAYALQETLRTGEPLQDPIGIGRRQIKRAFMKYIGARLGIVA